MLLILVNYFIFGFSVLCKKKKEKIPAKICLNESFNNKKKENYTLNTRIFSVIDILLTQSSIGSLTVKKFVLSSCSFLKDNHKDFILK